MPFDLMISPFHRFLRLEILSADKGTAEIRLPLRPELLRADNSDWVHGGVVSALMDIAGDCALYSKIGSPPPTVDLRIDFLRPAKGDLVAKSRVVRAGRLVGVCDIEVHDSQQQLVAVGRGVYAMATPSTVISKS